MPPGQRLKKPRNRRTMGNADSKALLATDFARMRAVSIPDDDNAVWQHLFELPSSAMVRGRLTARRRLVLRDHPPVRSRCCRVDCGTVLATV